MFLFYHKIEVAKSLPARTEAMITQDELAKRTGTKKVIYPELRGDKVIFRFRPITN